MSSAKPMTHEARYVVKHAECNLWIAERAWTSARFGPRSEALEMTMPEWDAALSDNRALLVFEEVRAAIPADVAGLVKKLRNDNLSAIEKDEAADALEALARENAGLGEVVDRYGRHEEACMVGVWDGVGDMPCDCGYRAALAKLDAGQGGKET